MNGHNMSSFFSAFGLSMSDCVDMLNSHKSSWKEGISFSLSFDWQANTYIIILTILHTVGTMYMSEVHVWIVLFTAGHCEEFVIRNSSRP